LGGGEHKEAKRKREMPVEPDGLTVVVGDLIDGCETYELEEAMERFGEVARWVYRLVNL
jgi:hypothetical protein